ncbi:MAG: type II secretion system protein GspD, partial [Planctomycetota bacterium]
SAQVQIRDNAPIEKIVTERGNLSYSVTDYQWVEDTLRVTPFVYSDGSIGLNTHITVGSKSKPEGVVQTSIITERSIDVGENRLAPGKSLIIGGMRKSEKRSVVRGVPFFKDLPIIGILFSSKDFEEKATEIIFILTPSISSGGIEYEDAADMVRKKFETPDYESDIDEIVTDPLGTEAYSEMVEKQTEQAEVEMVRLQVQAAQAMRQAQTEQLRAEKAILNARAMRAQAQEARALIEKAQTEKKAAEAEKQAVFKEAEAQKALITQTQAQIDKAQAEVAAARAAAEKAKSELNEAEQKVQSYTQEETKARDKARRIQQQIDALEKQSSPAEKTQPQSPPPVAESENQSP